MRRLKVLTVIALTLIPSFNSLGYSDWIFSAYVSLNDAIASKIELESLSFDSALDFVAEKTRLTTGETIKFTKEFRPATGKKTINVSARNISMRALLDEICKQAQVSYAPNAHDQWTLIIRDKKHASDKTQEDPVY